MSKTNELLRRMVDDSTGEMLRALCVRPCYCPSLTVPFYVGSRTEQGM
ncbi:MAG: hypothetical protein LBH14_01875 [Desulfobulbaceae bacterium]|jgi:hypothetical protein|nr:hypothetical protein [Desulfobulbaceae bacterium]